MNNIADHAIDLICTDLPFGTTNCSRDIVISFDELWVQYKRVIKSNGCILLFGQEPFSSFVHMSNLDWYRYDWYWQKEKPTNIFQLKRRPGKTIETISVFYAEQCYYNPQMNIHQGALVRNKPKGNHSTVYAGNTKTITAYEDDGYRYPSQLISMNREKMVMQFIKLKSR